MNSALKKVSYNLRKKRVKEMVTYPLAYIRNVFKEDSPGRAVKLITKDGLAACSEHGEIVFIDEYSVLYGRMKLASLDIYEFTFPNPVYEMEGYLLLWAAEYGVSWAVVYE